MIARILLILSCTLGTLIGCGFIAASIYGTTNPNLASELSEKIDLSAVPQVEKIKNDVVTKFNESGILQTIWNTFLVIGSIIVSVCGLGLLAAITAMKILLILYIIAQGLMLALFALLILLLFDENSVIGRKLTDELATAQDTKFYSIVALLDGKASDGAFITVFLNVLQVMVGCCGARIVGDIRNSTTWQASERGLAGLLKLGKNDSSTEESSGVENILKGVMGDEPVAKSDSSVPYWIRNRIPPGSTLPPDVNLPDELPEGVVIPKDFNITDLDILRNSTAIRLMFEESLVLQTPISCCQFKKSDAIFKMKPRDLVSSMKDPDCPFSAENGPGVHTETCYKKAVRLLKGYASAIIIAGIIIGLFMTCNLTLAVQLLICG